MLTCVNLLLRLVGTSFQVYLSSRIGAAGIGLLQLTMSVGSLAMIAGIGGIRTATMYLTAEELGRKQRQNVTWVLSGCVLYSILCSGTVAFTLYHFAPWIAENWIGDIRTLPALRLFAAFLPCTCITGVMTGYFTAANRIGTLAAVEVAEQILSMTVTLTALHFWAGADPARACLCVVLGGGVSGCFTLISLLILRLREQIPTGERIPIGTRLWKTAVPLALADDLKSGITTAENLMVPRRLALCTSIAEPLAAFGMVNGMLFPILMFPSCILFALAELLIPELARCNAADSRRRILYLSRRSLKVALIYGVFFSGLMFLLAEPLCIKLYGNPEAGQYLKLYALLVPMLYCDAITDAMIKGLGQQTASVRYNIFTSALDVLFLYILLPKYGMMGYFFSFFITHLINFALSIRRLLRITGQRIPLHLPLFSLFATFGTVWIVSHLQNPVCILLCYPLLLGCGLYLLGILHKANIRWILGLIRKK